MTGFAIVMEYGPGNAGRCFFATVEPAPPIGTILEGLKTPGKWVVVGYLDSWVCWS